VTVRSSKGGGIVLAIIGIWALVLGSFWIWSGLSITAGAISADCERIEMRAFGAFLGRNGGTCLALEDKSSWGIPGLLAALIVLLVGAAVLAGALWLLSKAADVWNEAHRTAA
jgi:hypothetical protein